MIACRLLKPGSKLRVERELGPSGRSTLAALLDIPNASADDLYEAMDWLAKRQPAISSPAPSPSTTSPPGTSKAPAASSLRTATPATTAPTDLRSCTACCAIAMAALSPCRPLPATPPTPTRSPTR